MIALKRSSFFNIMSEVYIYRTSVTNKTEIKSLTLELNNLEEIIKLNFDLEDCDNILRIESKTNPSKKIISILQSNNFICEEIL